MVRLVSKPCLWAALLLGALEVCAQEYSFRSFGNNDGLSNLAVRKIYQDRVGFLWVSTENGLFRYDGEHFDEFGPAQGLPSTSGVAMADAPDGSLLVGGGFGLYRLRANHFEPIAGNFSSVSWNQGIANDQHGHTWIGTDRGLYELTPGAGSLPYQMRLISPPPSADSPAAYGVLSAGHVLWYGCGHRLCRVESGHTDTFGPEAGLPDAPVVALCLDHDGALWLRVRDQGIFTMAAGGHRFERPHVNSSDPSMVGIPTVDAHGQVLLPAANGFLLGLNNHWRSIGSRNGLRGDVHYVFEDRQHTLWIGLTGRGLVQWRGYDEWESYSTNSGLPSDVVYEILPAEHDTLWAGTEGGLAVSHDAGHHWQRVQELPPSPVHSIRPGPGRSLWISTETHGVVRFDPTTASTRWYGHEQGLEGLETYILRVDHQQRVWVGTDAGLFRADPPYQRFERIPDLPSARVWSIAETSDHTLWVGSISGLYALVQGRWNRFTPSDGLSSQEILTLGTDSDASLWIGYRYGGGIDHVRLDHDRIHVDRNSQRPGTTGLVYFLEHDAQGRFWVGTEHGVDLWNGRRWQHYDANDGMVWNDCNLNSFAYTPDGTFWIGTSAGLSRFHPQLHTEPRLPLEVVFTRLTIGDVDVSGQTNPLAASSSNSLSAHFAALNALRSNAVLFRYRLIGAHDDWAITDQHALQFAALAPGRYLLEVEAQDDNGQWSSRLAQFEFRVAAPWYIRPSFLLLIGLVPLVFILLALRYRMMRVSRRERELQRLMEAHDEIRTLAFYDPLTGLPNRRLLLDRLRKLLAAPNPSGLLRALLFVDLDNFKTLNDSMGHPIGDLLLQEVARRLTGSIRKADTVARLGGDEFVVLLEDLSSHAEEAANQAEMIAEKILLLISQPFLLDGHQCRSASSIGITLFGDQPTTASDLLQQADIAMYQSKAAGRNTVRFFAPALQAAVNARAALEAELRQAIQLQQFELFYQPQITAGQISGAEVLVRWHHPERGLLLPGSFVGLAEETGLILPIGDWVLAAACRQLALWSQRPETADLRLAANISARQFRQPDFVDHVLIALERSGARAEMLKLELTETMLVENIEDVIAKMTELKRHGLRFSMDDFGTGYSSLSYLKRLPLDQIKIDRAFIEDMLHDRAGEAIVQTIITLSHSLDLSVMAEGVETAAQRDRLAQLGCDAYQGFLVSPPVPITDYEQLLGQILPE